MPANAATLRAGTGSSADYFEEPFAEATYSFRMSHYPPAKLEKDQFEVSAHAIKLSYNAAAGDL